MTMMYNLTTIGYQDNDVTMENVYHGYRDSTEPTEGYYSGYTENRSQSNMTSHTLPASTEAVIGLSILFCIIGKYVNARAHTHTHTRTRTHVSVK